VQFNCVNKLYEIWTECSLAQHRFVSSVCLLVRVTVVCCLLATSAVILCEKMKRKRKMWSKKWHLKMDISCDVHLLSGLVETHVECLQLVWAGTLGNCGIVWVIWQFSAWNTSGKDSSDACAIPCQNCAVKSVSPSGMTSHCKSLFNRECLEHFRLH
jgi:hypothetical protein